MTIGEKIKSIRKEKGLSQEQLAEKCGLNRNSIYNYETGKRSPKSEDLENIAKALDVYVSELTMDSADFSALFERLSNTFDNSTPNNLMCIRPLNKREIVEYFRCIALSIPHLSDLLPGSDEALYILLHSQEFKACIDLLTCKYKNAKIKRYGNEPLEKILPSIKDSDK